MAGSEAKAKPPQFSIQQLLWIVFYLATTSAVVAYAVKHPHAFAFGLTEVLFTCLGLNILIRVIWRQIIP